MSDSSWTEFISDVMEVHGDSWDNVVAMAPADIDLDRRFDSGYGASESAPFTLWTKTRVYFPVVYDGSEWAASVPRDPCDEATEHVGGEPP